MRPSKVSEEVDWGIETQEPDLAIVDPDAGIATYIGEHRGIDLIERAVVDHSIVGAAGHTDEPVDIGHLIVDDPQIGAAGSLDEVGCGRIENSLVDIAVADLEFGRINDIEAAIEIAAVNLNPDIGKRVDRGAIGATLDVNQPSAFTAIDLGLDAMPGGDHVQAGQVLVLEQLPDVVADGVDHAVTRAREQVDHRLQRCRHRS